MSIEGAPKSNVLVKDFGAQKLIFVLWLLTKLNFNLAFGPRISKRRIDVPISRFGIFVLRSLGVG